MKVNDAISGAIFLAIAILVFVHAGTFPTMPGVAFGPDLFPRLIAVMMGGGSAILIARSLVGARRPLLVLDDWARRPRSYVLFAAVVGSVLFYIALSEALGFILTACVMLTGLLLVTRGLARGLSSLAIAVLVTGGLHLLFADVLRVPLPFGVVEHWLVG